MKIALRTILNVVFRQLICFFLQKNWLIVSIRLGGPAHGIVTKNCTQNSAKGVGVGWWVGGLEVPGFRGVGVS